MATDLKSQKKKKDFSFRSDLVSNHVDFLSSVQKLSRLPERNNTKQGFNNIKLFWHHLSKNILFWHCLGKNISFKHHLTPQKSY
jgi:hypothetical protein